MDLSIEQELESYIQEQQNRIMDDDVFLSCMLPSDDNEDPFSQQEQQEPSSEEVNPVSLKLTRRQKPASASLNLSHGSINLFEHRPLANNQRVTLYHALLHRENSTSSNTGSNNEVVILRRISDDYVNITKILLGLAGMPHNKVRSILNTITEKQGNRGNHPWIGGTWVPLATARNIVNAYLSPALKSLLNPLLSDTVVYSNNNTSNSNSGVSCYTDENIVAEPADDDREVVRRLVK